MSLFRRLVTQNFARDTATDPTIVLGAATGLVAIAKAAPIVAAAAHEAQNSDGAPTHDGNDALGALSLDKGSSNHGDDSASPVSHFHSAADHAPLPEKHAAIDGHDFFGATESLIGNHAGVLTDLKPIAGTALSTAAAQGFGAQTASLTSFVQAEHEAAPHHTAIQPATDPAPAGVDPELWIAASAGLDENLITHADDDGTGNGTASNPGSLFTPVSANNPSAADHIDGLDLLQLDTQDNVYFIGTELGSTSAKIMEGSLSSVLASPTNTPTFTTLFSDSAGSAAITGLAVDPDNATVYFVDTQSFEKVGYGGGTVTDLDTAGVFLDGLALDLPHHVAYFASATSGITTTTTFIGGTHVHYHDSVTSNSIYETSSLTNSSVSVTISKLADVPLTDGAIFDGVALPGITVDTATGTIYFTTKHINGQGEGGLWSMDPTTQVITKIYQQTGTGSTVNTGIMSSIVIDHATGEYFVSILNASGTGGGIYVGHIGSSAAPTLFETLPTYSGGTISPDPGGFSVDNAPTLASVSGTGTEAVQGGSALSALTADGTDADSDNDKGDGAVIVITNGQTGDKLMFGGATSGTLDAGKVSFSYNSTTHTMTLSGTDSFAEYQTLLDQIQFQDTGTDNSAGSHPTRTITFQDYDGLLTSAVTGATTTTLVIDRAPTLGADSYSVLESGSASGTSGTAGTGVLGNDSDLDGDSLVVTAVNGSGANVGSGTFQGTYGHLNLASNGSYTYTADNTGNIDGAATGSHPVDTFTYTVSDGLGGVTTQTVSFTLDRAPALGSDSYTVVESGSVSGTGGTGGTGVLGNDTDKDGDSLTITAVNGSGANVGSGTFQGTYGHLNLASTGSFTYSADNTAAIDSAATGSHLTDSFTYTVSDGHGGSTTQSVTFTLDRAPTVTTQNESVAESGTNTGTGGTAGTGALAGDSDRDGDTVQVTKLDGNTINDTLSNFAGTYGHLTIGNDGSYSYVADNTAAIDGAATGSHPVDTFTLTVDDGHGGTTAETLNFAIDRPAVATADAIATTENAAAVVGGGNPNLLANDVDKDGDAITLTQVNGSAGNVGTQITLASGALLTVNADGTYTYDPNHVFDYLPGSASGASNTSATDSFSYTIDGGSTVTVTVTVNGVDSNDTLIGTSGADTLNGGIGDDIVYDDNGLSGKPLDTSAGASGGTDSFSGGIGNDAFYMGANLIAAGQIDGGTGTDHVILNGDYSAGLTFNATTMVNVEFLAVTAGHSYTLTLDAATVALGQTLTVQGGTLGAGDSLSLDGSADAGAFTMTSGAGNDSLSGGSAADTFTPGAGTDTVDGNGGDDLILMQGNLTAADAIDGGSGTDTLRLNGDYSAGLTFGATTVTAVETIALIAGNSYSLTIADATVASGSSLTVNGLGLGAGDSLTFDGSADLTGGTLILDGGAGNDSLTGGHANDTIRGGAGTDTVHGGGGNDVIAMDGTLTAADTIDGGSGTDTLRLDGDYSAGVTFGATTLTSIEDIQLAAGNGYKLAIADATVASGATLAVSGNALGSGDSLIFDGSADTTGGTLILNGGAGNDTLTGGHSGDTLRGGAGTNLLTGGGGADILVGSGTDTFVYNAVSDSTGAAHDIVRGFDALSDLFQIAGVTVSAIDPTVTHGTLDSGNTHPAGFDLDLSHAIRAGQLGAHHAVLFTPDGGSQVGHTYLIVDVNGTAGYQAGQDLVIDITGATNLASFSTANFS